MHRFAFIISAAIAAMITAGCASQSATTEAPPRPTPKAQATAQWNDARAAVMGGLAEDQFKNGNFDKSRQSVDEALRLSPNNAVMHVLSAKLAIEQGQLELADKELATARVLDQNNAEADYLSGVVCQRWQKPDAAAAFYAIAADKAPGEVAYVLARAEMLVAMSKRDEAIAYLQEKTIHFEHSPALRDAMGELLVQANRLPEAIESLREAMALANDDSSIRLHLAMACFQDRQYREAADLFSRLLHDPANENRADLHLAQAECLMQSDRSAEARLEYEATRSIDPQSLAAWLGLGKVALTDGDFRCCENAIDHARAIEPASADNFLLLGCLRLKQQKYPEALAAFQSASTLDRADPLALCLMGCVLQKTGRGSDATALYSQALHLKPNDPLALKLMASADAD